MYINNPNDIWISVYPARFYHFDGTSVTNYTPQNRDMYLSSFFKETNGDLITTGVIPIQTNKGIFQMLKLVNNTWTNFLSDTIILNITPLQGIVYICETNYLRMGINSLYYFTGNSWSFFTNTADFYVRSLSGKALNNFLCCGIKQTSYYNLYYFNGDWYKQSNFLPPQVNYYDEIIVSKEKNYNYYGFFKNNFWENYFFIGRPKLR
jgi:hypothetical protein